MDARRIAGLLWIGLVSVLPGSRAGDVARPNVLLIAVDDLRPHLGAYGVAHARTPAMDRLAKNSRVFLRHFTQVPTCGASRRALMSGLYPRAGSDLGNNAILANSGGWAKHSLPAVFRAQGYRTIALGKITHHPGGRAGQRWVDGPQELPGAWDIHRVELGTWPDPEAFMHGYAGGKAREPGKSPVIERAKGPDTLYPDAWTAAAAVDMLDQLASKEQPWLLAVGFIKPHLPFAAPDAWHQLFDDAAIPAPVASGKPGWPSGWHPSGEMRNSYFHDGRNPDIDAAHALALRRAYTACVSYADAQIGKVLDALDRSGRADNTVVVLWGDHGFHLGEHGIWGKHCLFEEALHSPLIVRVPGKSADGRACPAIVETVDILPTLIDYCRLPEVPGLDGRSLRPWIENPEIPTAKGAAGYWTHGQRTLRDDRWRLIAGDNDTRIELFDLANDPCATREVSADFPDVVKSMLAKLPRPVVNPVRPH